MRRISLACLSAFAIILGQGVVPAADFYVVPVKKCCTCEGQLVGTRWCDNQDGTVTDLTTCLVWLKYANWGGQKPLRNPSTDCSAPNYLCYDNAHQRASILRDGSLIFVGFPFSVSLNDGSVEGDWRLPTKTELVGIRTGIEPVGSAEPRAFRFVQADDYWTSTTHAGHDDWAWIVHFTDDNVNIAEYTAKGSGYYVWPVREVR